MMQGGGGGRAAPFFPIIGCCVIGLCGLAIAAMIIISLIPLYLDYRAVPRSSKAIKPYSLSNVGLTASGTGKRELRALRDTQSPRILAGVTIQAIQDKINVLLTPINAQCIITKATMLSLNSISVDMEIFFDAASTSSSQSELDAIQKVLASEKTIKVDLQYYTDCNSNPIDKGPTVLTLQIGSTVFENVPPPTTVPLGSIVQQPDQCQLNPICGQVFTNELNLKIASASSPGYTYYCYYWTPPSPFKEIDVGFAFSNTAKQVYIDDITFNASTNLIQNGGFEISSASVLWDCNGDCSNNIVQENPHSGKFSFRSPGGNVPLQQTVSVPASDKTKTYQFGFWLNFACSTSNPCSVSVTAKEEKTATTIQPKAPAA